VSAPAGVLQSLDYTYDADGRRTKTAREDGTSIYCNYDAVSRLTGEEWPDSGDQGLYSFSYEFDASGNRILLKNNGLTTYYEYNSLNQLTLTVNIGRPDGGPRSGTQAGGRVLAEVVLVRRTAPQLSPLPDREPSSRSGRGGGTGQPSCVRGDVCHRA